MQSSLGKPIIREIEPVEYTQLGRLMVEVYSRLEGFPTQVEQPKYYEMLRNVGKFNEKEGVQVLIALSKKGQLAGGVVYFSDMAKYGSGGIATKVKNDSGLRLLGVGHEFRGMGIGRALSCACIDLAYEHKNSQVILHTTMAMQVAWELYTRLGFERSPELDFYQEELPVFGFRLFLKR